MKTIWKYPIPVTDEFELEMSIGARVIAVDAQHDTPCIWALVDPGAPTWPVRFSVKGTGHPFPDHEYYSRHIGTFQLEGGALVFHLFQHEDVPMFKGRQ